MPAIPSNSPEPSSPKTPESRESEGSAQEQDRKISNELLHNGILQESELTPLLKELAQRQSLGETLGIAEILCEKKLLPPDFPLCPIIENITDLAVLTPDQTQFTGVRKEKILWILTATLTERNNYETLRDRVKKIRESNSSFLLNPKGVGKLYPWKIYLIRNLPQGLNFFQFLATSPEVEDIQNFTNSLLQGLAELETHFTPLPPSPEWTYIDSGVLQIAGQEGAPFAGTFTPEYQNPEPECPHPINVYPVGKMLLKLYYQSTDISEDFKKSTFPRDILLRKMIYPNPKLRYTSFSQVWDDWQKVQLGMSVESLENFPPFPKSHPSLDSHSPRPVKGKPEGKPESEGKAEVEGKAKGKGKNKAKRKRKKNPILSAALLSAALLLFSAVVFFLILPRLSPAPATLPATTKATGEFEKRRDFLEAQILNDPENLEEHLFLYRRFLSETRNPEQHHWINQRLKKLQEIFTLKQQQKNLQEEFDQLFRQKEWEKATQLLERYEEKYPTSAPPDKDSWLYRTQEKLHKEKTLAQQSTPPPTPEESNETPEESNETPEESNETPASSNRELEVSEWEDLRADLWLKGIQGEFQEGIERLNGLFGDYSILPPEVDFYLARFEEMPLLQTRVFEKIRLSPPTASLKLLIRGQTYQGSVRKGEAPEELKLELKGGGSFPFYAKDIPFAEWGKWEAFSSPEESAFYWMLTDQLEKATEILQTLPEGSPYLREHLQRLQSDKNALEQSEETEKRWERLQKLAKQKNYKGAKQLWDRSLAEIQNTPFFLQHEEEILLFHTQILKALDTPALVLSGGIHTLEKEALSISYRFRSPEALLDFNCLGSVFQIHQENLRFQGTLSYPKISWKTLQVEFFWNAFTSLEFYFGAFHCPFTPQQIASFPLSENLTSRKKILLRFTQNQCEIEYQGQVLGTIPWEGKGGMLSWVAPEIAELSALHLSGSYDFKALESFSQALQNYNKENPPLTSGVEVKRYRGTEFIWLEEELRLPRFESQFEEPLFQKEPPFALRWKAWIYFPQAGKYTFYWDADEGVRFYIFGDLVLDTFKLNTAQGTPEEIQQKKKVTKELRAGFIPIEIEQIQQKGGGFLSGCLEKETQKIPFPFLFCRQAHAPKEKK